MGQRNRTTTVVMRRLSCIVGWQQGIATFASIVAARADIDQRHFPRVDGAAEKHDLGRCGTGGSKVSAFQPMPIPMILASCSLDMIRITNPSAAGPRSHQLRHTAGMSRHSAFARALWLLAIAVLAVRVGDAHLHFCGDGKEQPIALHVADAPGQHHTDEGAHQDRDLDISGPTLVKKVSGLDELTLAPVLAFALVLLLPIVRRIEPLADTAAVVLTPLFSLRPPLRGPPR